MTKGKVRKAARSEVIILILRVITETTQTEPNALQRCFYGYNDPLASLWSRLED